MVWKSRKLAKIIKSLPNEDLGVVFNFHHAHHDLAPCKEHILKLCPYLWGVSLNGMKAAGPKILPIGKGDLEKDMIQYLVDIGFKGPFNILGHVKGTDPELILEENFNGLKTLFKTD